MSAPTNTPAPPDTARPRPTPLVPPARKLPGFRVLLHNDDINEMGYVVRTIVMLAHLDPSSAFQVMMAAHNGGVALVLVTHKERAELFREQFASRGLKVTIEPDGR